MLGIEQQAGEAITQCEKVNFLIGCRLPTPPLDDIATLQKYQQKHY